MTQMNSGWCFEPFFCRYVAATSADGAEDLHSNFHVKIDPFYKFMGFVVVFFFKRLVHTLQNIFLR